MSISEKIGADIIVAMKAKDEHRLTTLRMVKSALRSKEIDKREPLTDAEQTAILSTLLFHGKREPIPTFCDFALGCDSAGSHFEGRCGNGRVLIRGS